MSGWSLLKKGREAYREGGIRLVFDRGKKYMSRIHQRIRPYLPVTQEYGTRNDIIVLGVQTRVFDNLAPWHNNGKISDWKASEYEQLRKHVREGDQVTIIGGGLGSNAVLAGRLVGEKGNVVIYEGNSNNCEAINRTLEYNDVSERCDVVNAIIMSEGQDGFEMIVSDDTKRLSPSEIATGDLLDLDVEGAEWDIINQLPESKLPMKLIVESHHMYDYCPYESPSELRTLIENRGYRIIDEFSGRWVEKGFVAELNR